VKKKIFVVTYGGGHVNIMIPIIKELQKRDDITLSILGLSIASEALRNAGINHHTLLDYRDIIMDDKAWVLGKRLAEKNHVEGKGIKYEETVVYFGSSMRDLAQSEGEERALRLLEIEGKNCFIPSFTMGRILDYEKPDLLVTGNCPRMERAAMTVARKDGIKVLSLNDLLGFDKKYIFPADKIAVISEITRENLINQGNPPDNIVVTGSPVFDLITNEMKEFDRGTILRELSLPANAKVFLLATQPQKDCTWAMIDMMIALLERYPEHYLVVKNHPGDDDRPYIDFLRKRNHPRVVLSNIPVRKIIFVSDIAITIYSTVGLESILMGTPLIQLNLMGIANPIPLYRFNVCLEATSYNDLEKCVKSMLEDGHTKKMIEENRMRYFGNIIAGTGLDNCMKLIGDLSEAKH